MSDILIRLLIACGVVILLLFFVFLIVFFILFIRQLSKTIKKAKRK